MKTDEKIIQHTSKKLPMVIAWDKKAIHLGDLEFLKDGSLVFESHFHNDSNVGSFLEFGISNFKDGKFYNRNADKIAKLDRGFHISLHPQKKDKCAAMHFREHSPGQILYRREINWYPVKQAFNLIRFYTIPLDMCTSSSKKVTVETSVDPNYKDSLELIVDIFPKNTEPNYHVVNSIVLWGYCPDYWVRLNIMLAKQRTPALIYWPEDSLLSL